jgi:hypothetical protein
MYIPKEDINNELQQRVHSLYNIEDMKGSKSDKYRHVRIELKSKTEYEQILQNGGITIDGQLIEAHEFLAPPRLLMCIKCNEPGHIKKNCTVPYDVCRRCGKDRSVGEHTECIISCHRCQQQHLSTDYKCEYLINYCRSLLNQLKEKPNMLPPNVRLFIPVDCRDRNNKMNKMLINPLSNTHLHTKKPNKEGNENAFNIKAITWPALSDKSFNQSITHINEKSIWDDLKMKQQEIDKLKEDLNIKLLNHQTKYNENLKKMNIILLNITQQTKYQNEGIDRCYTTINEVLPILSSTLEVVKRMAIKLNVTNENKTDDCEFQTLLEHISQALEFIKDRNELLVNNQKVLNQLVEQQGQLMIDGMNNLISNDE